MSGFIARKEYDSHRHSIAYGGPRTLAWCRVTLDDGETIIKRGRQADLLNHGQIGQEVLIRNNQVYFGGMKR